MGSILVAAAVPQELAAFRPSDGSVLPFAAGMGRRAEASTQKMLRRQPISLVIITGFAGGVLPGMRVGDLVMASEVVEEVSGRTLKPSPAVTGMGLTARVGPFLTVPSVLAHPSAKSERGRRFGAVAVEMETAWIAGAAEEAGIPWVALRTILDPMEVLLAVTSLGQALRMLAVPTRWKQLSNFMQSVETAGRSLAEGLNLVISNVIPAQAGIRSSLSRG